VPSRPAAARDAQTGHELGPLSRVPVRNRCRLAAVGGHGRVQIVRREPDVLSELVVTNASFEDQPANIRRRDPEVRGRGVDI